MSDSKDHMPEYLQAAVRWSHPQVSPPTGDAANPGPVPQQAPNEPDDIPTRTPPSTD